MPSVPRPNICSFLGCKNTKAFGTRLNWLSAKFKDIDRASCAIDPAAGNLSQTSIDDLMQSLGL